MEQEKFELEFDETWSSPPPSNLSKRDELLERLRKRAAYKDFFHKSLVKKL